MHGRGHRPDAICCNNFVPTATDPVNVMPAVAGHRLQAISRDSSRALHGKELVTQLISAVPVP